MNVKQQDKRQTTEQMSNNRTNVKQQDELENPELTAKRLPIVRLDSRYYLAEWITYSKHISSACIQRNV